MPIKLELLGIKVWVDSRNLRGGGKLKPEIEQAIKDAHQVIEALPRIMAALGERLLDDFQAPTEGCTTAYH